MYQLESILNTIIHGNSLDILRQIPDTCINVAITSPPYFGKRDYSESTEAVWGGEQDCEHEWGHDLPPHHPGQVEQTKWANAIGAGKGQTAPSGQFCTHCRSWKGQLGLEPTPSLYIQNLVKIFTEVMRVLKPYGSLYVNLGDSYNNNPSNSTESNLGNASALGLVGRQNRLQVDTPTKSLLCIPDKFKMAMVERGWVCRNELIWKKPNAMPQCLSPKTKIFTLNMSNNLIEQMTMGDLLDQDYNNLRIMSPTGWVRINNIWKTKKKRVEFNTGAIDHIICSPDHRFLVVKDSHRNRKKKKTFESIKNTKTATKGKNHSHKIVYTDISTILNNKIPIYSMIDITKIRSVDWFASFEDMDTATFQKTIGKTSLELAKYSKDKTLRKYYYENKNTWTYASDTHNEYRRKRIRVDRLNALGIKFEKVKAMGSPKTENRFFILDYELGWAIGLYCAEGGFNQPRGFQGKVTLEKTEREFADKFINTLRRKFGVLPTENKNKNYNSITFGSATFYALATFLVKGNCTEKALNLTYLLNTPESFRRGLWDGYIDGDGSKRLNGTGGFSVASASEQLIRDCQVLGASLGKLASLKTGKQVLDVRTQKTHKHNTLWSNGDHYYNIFKEAFVRIKDLHFYEEEDEFIDIKVEGGAFVIETGIISHNSSSDRFTEDFEKIFFFVKSNSDLFWTNEKTLELITKPPKGTGGIEGTDFCWIPCPNCNKPKEAIQASLEEPGEPPQQENGACKRCGGLGRIKQSYWQSHDYYFEQQLEPYTEPLNRWGGSSLQANGRSDWDNGTGQDTYRDRSMCPNPLGRNKRTVWDIPEECFVVDVHGEAIEITTSELEYISQNRMRQAKASVWDIVTKPMKESHYASYPKELIETPIKASCPEFVCKKCGMPRVKIYKSEPMIINRSDYGEKSGNRTAPSGHMLEPNKKSAIGYTDCGCGAGFTQGIVLDMFMGSGTTAITAKELGRRYIGCELNPDYIKIAQRRIERIKGTQKRMDFFEGTKEAK